MEMLKGRATVYMKAGDNEKPVSLPPRPIILEGTWIHFLDTESSIPISRILSVEWEEGYFPLKHWR